MNNKAVAQAQAQCEHPNEYVTAGVVHITDKRDKVVVCVECRLCGKHLGGNDIFVKVD